MNTYHHLTRRLARGWNTWNTRSVLSHVLLPEGIAVNTGFKHYAGGDYLKEALIGRRGEHDEKIHPGLRTYDGTYTDLRLSWKGCAWRVQTAAAGDEWVMLVTPLDVAMPRPPLVVAELGLLWNRPGRLSHGEQCLCAETPARSIRLYGTAQPIPEPYIWAQGPYLALPADREVGFATGRALSLDEIRERINTGRAARTRQGESWGEQAEIRDAMQSCLAWDTVYDPLFDRVISPVSRIWNTNWGGYVMFCWDSYFAAAMAAVDNKELAYANAIAVTREGIANGFVPNFVSPSGYQSRDRSQPPVGSLTVLDIHRRHRERWFLEEVYADLLAWNRWWPEHRQFDGLLAWGSHPYTPVVGNGGETHCTNERFGAALESGLDNAPMYDDIPFDAKTHLLQLQDVGLTSLYIADCDALAEIATVLGRTVEAAELRARADRFRTAMQRLWDEKTGLFLNRRTDTGRFEHRLSPTHFYPLLAGVPSAEQARRMIDEHFFNPDEFWGEWILPACARNDPAYPEQEYWRGRIWAPMNWLVYLGLRRYDLPEARRALAEKSSALLLKEWRGHGHVHENYCADSGQGCNVERSDAFYHWGGLLGLIEIQESESQPPWSPPTASPAAPTCLKEASTMARVELQPTTGPLPRNPAMGWAIYIDQDGTTLLEDGRGRLLDPGEFWKRMAPALPFASQLYLRLPWSEYEPEQGRYAWECNPRFREIIDEARRRGLRLAFRWYTDGRDCHRQATPDYVRAAGAAGDTLPTDGKGPLDGRWWWTPWSDDPVLHRCLGEFVQAFAARFDDVATTDLVDHGLGRWGEMHSFVFADMGRYNAAAPQVLVRMAELHQRAFQQVIRCHNFCGWGSDRAVEDKVLGDLGHCIRRDGLGSPRWFNRAESELLASYWPRVPVFGENCYWNCWQPEPTWIQSDGFAGVRACLERVFADARTVHANTLDLRTVNDIGAWLKEAPDLVERFRREAGYGLLPTVVEFPDTLPAARTSFTIRHLWRNLGWGVLPNRAWGGRVAAAFALLDAQDHPLHVFRSAADPGEWVAGMPYRIEDRFTMPALPNGAYRWAVALVDQHRDNRPWITLAAEDAKPGWLPLEGACHA